jgi:glycosyltransferase involved in cell wall biosynthesis
MSHNHDNNIILHNHMKIVYLITKSNWGGAQRYVYDLSTSLSAKGITSVVAFGGEGELKSRLSDAGVRTHTFASLTRDVSLGREISGIKEVYRFIAHEKPDILHLNSSKAAGVGAFVGRLCGVGCIVTTLHGAPFKEDRGFVSKKLIYFFTWLTCIFSHKVITVNKQDEADIGAMFFMKKKVTTVYLGLAYEPLPPRTAPKDRVVRIVTVGELTKNKGYVYGLHAIELLKQRGLRFSYTIIGEGEDRKKLEEFITMKRLGDVVTMLGYQDARLALPNYDMYLLPSVKEGLPYILLEAGKVSLPVVATITGGVPEIIRHEETGLLVQPKDIEAMANALEVMMSDRKNAKHLGQMLHAHIVQNFSYSKMLVETAKVYGLVAGKK